MTQSPGMTVYGALWCPDCRRSKQFLAEHRIPYRWVDIEQEPEAQEIVRQLNDGRQIIPTIVFDDGGPILVEPSNADLAARLGINPQASRSYYDLIIVGGGPGGSDGRHLRRPGRDGHPDNRAWRSRWPSRFDGAYRQLSRVRGGDYRRRACRPHARAGRAFRRRDPGGPNRGVGGSRVGNRWSAHRHHRVRSGVPRSGPAADAGNAVSPAQRARRGRLHRGRRPLLRNL